MTWNKGTTATLSKFAKDAKLRAVANTPEGCAALQRDLNILGKRANRNPTKFSKKKFHVLTLQGDQ